MKFFHISDLHLGRRLNEFSMIGDQRHILEQITAAAEKERPDCVFIAGDVYDKNVPSEEAVSLFDAFLWSLHKLGVSVFIISGNHDSAERLNFGSRIMAQKGVHIARAFDGALESAAMRDEFGEYFIYMLPFIKPVQARQFFPESRLETTQQTVEAILSAAAVDDAKRNILIAHLYAAGGERCESEDVVIGGSDCVDGALFSRFDYTALGHLHGPQDVGGANVRYCGTPLKYSFSEARHKKSVTVGELREKGTIAVHEVPLVPLHDLREIRGAYDELAERSFSQKGGFDRNDYLHITLTDEDEIFEALAKLRTVYPNIMRLDYDNSRTNAAADLSCACESENRSPLELTAELFEKQNGAPLTEAQRDTLSSMIEKIWGDAQ